MCKWQLPNILIMDNFDLRKYLAENKLLKEETIDEIFGVAGRPRDRYLQRKKELSNQKNDKVTNYHDLLRYYQYAIAKIPRHKWEKATNAQAMHDRYGQEIWDVLKTSYSDRELSKDFRNTYNHEHNTLEHGANTQYSICTLFQLLHTRLQFVLLVPSG